METKKQNSRFRSAVIADVERRRNGTKLVQHKVSPSDFLNGQQLTASEKTKLLKMHTDVTEWLINIKQYCYFIGEHLFNSKKILGHGKFQPYIKVFYANDLPYSTAYFYMRVYEVFKETPELVKRIPTTHLLMMSHKDFPKELLDDLKKYCKQIDNKDLKQVSDLYNLWKKGRIGSNKFIQLAKEQIQIGIDFAHKSSRHRFNSIRRLSFEFGAMDIMQRIQELVAMACKEAGLFPPDPTSPQHKEIIKDADKIIEGVQRFKAVLEGRDKMFREVSTENGDKYISNI